MRRIILSPVAGLALPYFSTLSHKRQDFRENLLNIKSGFDFFYITRLKHFPFKKEFHEI
jgi:hypothetical protein